MSVAKVDHVLDAVTTMMPLWQVVRDCVDGQAAVKKRNTVYLPMPNATDTSDENRARYQAYSTRGLFVNMTARTLHGMVGTVFSKEPTVDLPTELEVLHQDVDGGAITMDQQAKQTLSDILAVGRCGLFTDFPPRNVSTTRAELLSGQVRPTIQFYFAEQIINWRVETIDGLRKLTLVVLMEDYIKEDDGFVKTMGKQYRVLRLVNKVYTVELYRDAGTGYVSDGEWTPTKSDGQPFDYIPFEFVGAQNNDPGVDNPPLLDLANLNIAHYRNSCDFEEIVFQVGNPTLVVAGLDADWLKDQLGGKIMLGSTTALTLPRDSTAELLQINESVIALKAMEHKERQAVAIGARLVQQQSVQRTAKEASLEDASQSSLLLTAAQNVNSAYRRALVSAGAYVGVTLKEEQGYELNTDFDILLLDDAALAARVKMWIDGIISFTEARSTLRRAGITTQEDEEAREEIDADAVNAAAALGMGDMDDEGNPVPPGKKPPVAEPKE